MLTEGTCGSEFVMEGGESIEQNRVVQKTGEQLAKRVISIQQENRVPVAIQLPVGIFDKEAIRILYGQKDGASTICLYLMLIAFAAKSNRGGTLYVADDIPYAIESIASLTHMDAKFVQNALSSLAKYGLIRMKNDAFYIVGYGKLVQFKVPRKKAGGAA